MVEVEEAVAVVEVVGVEEVVGGLVVEVEVEEVVGMVDGVDTVTLTTVGDGMLLMYILFIH